MSAQLVTPFTGTGKGLVYAFGLVKGYTVDERVHVHVHDGGQSVVFDLSHTQHPARETRYLCHLLGLVVTETPTDMPDGTAGTEFRGQSYSEGILLTVRAAVPVRALWPVTS